ncbi:MAG TPA: dephospho-CoA kinase [Alphaproteobacteria bacterium]|nr:dephospho-CoA kinase [Alphaproteobacteria bacterium]HOO51329.1 dephospho-CoA kinase [Alphaproteobacteria bacterium]
MKVIGLTGSIGMGKSVAGAMLQRMGIPVFDSDACVREVSAPHGKAFATIAQTFPEAWDKNKCTIDRQKLGEIVFFDDQARDKLEAILHPFVWHAQKEFLKAARQRKCEFAVLDIPLLFETGAQSRCDIVIVVSAPYLIQEQRVLARPNMDREKFQAILNRQMPQEEKNKLADYVIQTGLGRAHTLRQLKALIRNLQKKTDTELENA